MRPRITLTNAVGLTRVTSNRRVNQSSRIFLLTRPGFIEVDAAARIQSSIAGRIKLRNTPPSLASNDLAVRHRVGSKLQVYLATIIFGTELHWLRASSSVSWI